MNHHVHSQHEPANRTPYTIYASNGTEILLDNTCNKSLKRKWIEGSQADLSGHDTEPCMSSDSLNSCQPNSFFANLAAEAQQLLDSRRDWSLHMPSCSSISSSASTVSSSTFSSVPSVPSLATHGVFPSFDPGFGYVNMGGTSFAQNNGQLDFFTPQTGSTRWVGSCPWGWEAPREEIEEFSLGSGEPYKFD